MNALDSVKIAAEFNEIETVVATIVTHLSQFILTIW